MPVTNELRAWARVTAPLATDVDWSGIRFAFEAGCNICGDYDHLGGDGELTDEQVRAMVACVAEIAALLDRLESRMLFMVRDGHLKRRGTHRQRRARQRLHELGLLCIDDERNRAATPLGRAVARAIEAGPMTFNETRAWAEAMAPRLSDQDWDECEDDSYEHGPWSSDERSALLARVAEIAARLPTFAANMLAGRGPAQWGEIMSVAVESLNANGLFISDFCNGWTTTPLGRAVARALEADRG